MNHVMSRENWREDIFLDDVDRQNFLKTLAEACQKQPALVSGLNVMGGKITHKAVAGAHGLAYSAPTF